MSNKVTASELVQRMAESPIEDITEEARAVLAAGVDPDEYVSATIEFHRGSIVDEDWGTWQVEFMTAIARKSAIKAEMEVGIDADYEAYRASL